MPTFTFLGLRPDCTLEGEHVVELDDNKEETILSHPFVAHIPKDLRHKVVEHCADRACVPLSLPALGPRPTLIVDNPPLLLLDLDGVINMTSLHKADQMKLYPDVVEISVYSFAHKRHFPFRYSPSVVNSINRWATRAEIRWATSWVHLARYIIAPLIGLHDFEPICERSKRWHTVQDVPPETLRRSVIWIDDELERWGKDDVVSHLRKHAQSYRGIYPRGVSQTFDGLLGLGPSNTFDGLKPWHVKQVDEWLGFR
jgi:hypothetical protein